MFAVADLEGNRVSFKCTPDEFQELILTDGIAPAQYVARYHWVTIHKSGALRTSEIQRLIRDSYQMVFDKLPTKIKKNFS
jgi:predicted DNA-binding protein (MmcQ/YjbR family)